MWSRKLGSIFFTRLLQSLVLTIVALSLILGFFHGKPTGHKGGKDYARRFQSFFSLHSFDKNGLLPSFRKRPQAPVSSLSEAKRVSPRDLLKRGLPLDLTRAPKLLHQSWKDAKLPPKMQRWSTICRKKNPNWEYVLWTDEDNLKLIKTYVPWFLNTYKDLQSEIFRVDAIRNVYMHVFGGVYLDLDTECLQPYSTLFEKYNISTAPYDDLGGTMPFNASMSGGRKAFLGRMGTDEGSEHSIPNAWMASTPGHPFWLLPLEKIKDDAHGNGQAEYVTGPAALYKQVQSYREKYHSEENVLDEKYAKSGWKDLYRNPAAESLEILPFWAIYPYSWQRDGDPYKEFCLVGQEKFNSTRCKEVVGTSAWGSWSITYWSHSWDDHGGQHLEGLGGNTDEKVDKDSDKEKEKEKAEYEKKMADYIRLGLSEADDAGEVEEVVLAEAHFSEDDTEKPEKSDEEVETEIAQAEEVVEELADMLSGSDGDMDEEYRKAILNKTPEEQRIAVAKHREKQMDELRNKEKADEETLGQYGEESEEERIKKFVEKTTAEELRKESEQERIEGEKQGKDKADEGAAEQEKDEVGHKASDKGEDEKKDETTSDGKKESDQDNDEGGKQEGKKTEKEDENDEGKDPEKQDLEKTKGESEDRKDKDREAKKDQNAEDEAKSGQNKNDAQESDEKGIQDSTNDSKEGKGDKEIGKEAQDSQVDGKKESKKQETAKEESAEQEQTSERQSDQEDPGKDNGNRAQDLHSKGGHGNTGMGMVTDAGQPHSLDQARDGNRKQPPEEDEEENMGLVEPSKEAEGSFISKDETDTGNQKDGKEVFKSETKPDYLSEDQKRPEGSIKVDQDKLQRYKEQLQKEYAPPTKIEPSKAEESRKAAQNSRVEAAKAQSKKKKETDKQKNMQAKDVEEVTKMEIAKQDSSPPPPQDQKQQQKAASIESQDPLHQLPPEVQEAMDRHAKEREEGRYKYVRPEDPADGDEAFSAALAAAFDEGKPPPKKVPHIEDELWVDSDDPWTPEDIEKANGYGAGG